MLLLIIHNVHCETGNHLQVVMDAVMDAAGIDGGCSGAWIWEGVGWGGGLIEVVNYLNLGKAFQFHLIPF